ncbi:MAG TPA: LapA family protein [Gammaproteobacteria bacterium]|nr:LapA family protein [Gammaproteobacteria bacterium]
MLRLLNVLFLIVLVVLGISFAVLNADPVPLNYYFGYREIPLSMVVVVSLAVGAVIGVLASMGILLRQKHQLFRLRRQLKTVEKQAAEGAELLPADGQD